MRLLRGLLKPMTHFLSSLPHMRARVFARTLLLEHENTQVPLAHIHHEQMQTARKLALNYLDNFPHHSDLDRTNAQWTVDLMRPTAPEHTFPGPATP